MRTLLLASMLLSLGAAPSLAKDVTLAGTWVDHILMHDTAGYAEPGTEKKVTSVTLNGYAIGLESMPLTTIAEHFGGDIRMSGEAGEARKWLCYTTETAFVVIHSDGEMGDGKPTMVALDAGGPAPATAGCAVFPEEILTLDLGIPGIGSQAADIRAAYGPTPADETGSFSYVSLSPFTDRPTIKEWQDVTLHETGGVIDAIAVGQEGGD